MTNEIRLGQLELMGSHIEERIEYLECVRDDEDPDSPGLDEDEKNELKNWMEFKDGCDVYDGLEHLVFYREDTFEDHCREYAKDIGAWDSTAAWPYNCIDWKKAAEEHASSYSRVNVGGHEYLYLSE